MGYSGSISLNGCSLFREGKYKGDYCMKYAEVYNIQKEVPLTKKSINKVIQSLNNGVSSYGYLLFEISAATKVIGKLADLLNNKSY